MYEAHKWKIGEEITSEKLNHIEKGIEEAGLPREITNPQDGQTLKYDAAKGVWVNVEGGSGGGTSPLLVTVTLDENGQGTLDHTWQEIHDAMPNALLKTIYGEDGEYNLDPLYIRFDPSLCSVNGEYSTTRPTGYPTNVGGEGGLS